MQVKPPTGHASEETLEYVLGRLPALVNGRLPVDVPATGGGLTDVELRASPIPVSGSFYPATQPVSGTVSVSGSVPVTGTFWQATQPVSGTFWQQTQPVSGPITDSQLRASPIAVSGTFWQATQPVSGPLTDAQLRANAIPVSGTFWQATQPVSGSVSVSNFPATQAVSLASLPKAREDSTAMTWASVKSAAPTASAVQATTGALTAGDYDFDILLCASDTVAVGKGLIVEHRNAADSATLQTLGGCAAQGNQLITLRRYTIATNERIRVIAGTAAGAASSMYVSAIGRRTS